MHIELLVPGLLAAPPVPRLPALELLLARGRETQDEARTLERWLACAFGVADGTLPAGALTALADGGDPADGYWLRADPVHLEIGGNHPALRPLGETDIERAEADALATALNRHFEGEFTLFALRPERWCLRTARALALEAASPAELAAGEAQGILPQGADAARAHALLNEIQMLLHDHPVNLQREARGAAVINSVWLWGAGRLPRSARGPWQAVLSDDPLASGLARLAGTRHGALPQAAAQWLESAPPEGRHLCVLDHLRGASPLEAIEACWFAPLLAALRQGRIGMITLRIPDAGASWEITRADLRRFWRRPRALSACT